MKKRIFSLLALLLMLSMLFTACGGTTPAGNDDVTNAPGGTNPSGETNAPVTEEVIEDVSPYVVTETLFTAEVSQKLYELFEKNKGSSFSALLPANASFVMGNANAISDGRLLSMTIPVYKTGATDANGDFVFTLYVYDLGYGHLKQAAKKSYEIKINAATYGLEANKSKVCKAIKVDLTSYDITIAADEGIGFFAATDTLIPAYIPTSSSATKGEVVTLMREKSYENIGCFTKTGTAGVEYSQDTQVIDFEWEKTYESKLKYLADINEYDKMIAALKDKYKGKNLSMIGDSISAFAGICNDTTANATIGSNSPYYPTANTNITDSSLMYWGKVAKDLEMNICVTNAWAGSYAMGTDKQPNMLERAVQLHRDGGTPDNPADDVIPDVIIVYFGINDLNGGKPNDTTLVGLLNKAKDSEARKTAVGNWFKDVAAKADKAGSTKKGEAYDNFEQVYALSLRAMKEKYPNAEIYCMTYQESNHSNTSRSKLAKFTQSVSAIAEYFGATVVDQSKDEITFENCHAYGADYRALHPNAKGHAVMAKSIITEMYKKNK